jgi:peptidoglycan/LPS O-acetylase OafA/YrhL
LDNSFFRHFSRITTSGKYIPVIDGMRFISLLWIVLTHIGIWFLAKSPLAAGINETNLPFVFRIAEKGYFGVEIFFTISGFVLALPFALHYLRQAPSINLKSYYLRRLTRLEPPYIIGITFALIVTIISANDPIRDVIFDYLSRLFYVHDFVSTRDLIGGTFWTLAIEVQFYLMAPFVAHIFRLKEKRVRRGVLAVLIVGFSVVNGGLSASWIMQHVVTYFMQYFLLGFLLADIYVSDWNSRPVQQYRWDLIGLAGWGTILVTLMVFPMTTTVRVNSLAQLIQLPALLAIYISAFRGILFSKLLSLRFITIVGGMCYTIYLYHNSLIWIFGRFTVPFQIGDNPTLNYLIQVVLIVTPILMTSGVLFVLFERPFMNRYWPQQLLTWIRVRRVRQPKPHASNV